MYCYSESIISYIRLHNLYPVNKKLLVKTLKSKISKYKKLRDNFNINTTGNPTSP